MCFRPSAAAKPVECPNCGKKVPVIGGVKQKKCPFCKTDLADIPAPVEEFECPRCGQKNPVTASACGGCGLTAEEAANFQK